jgi:hypothetical protein
MHIPVLLIGLICGPLYGAIGGAIIPCLSSLLTGMPATYPMLPIMSGELITYGIISGYLRKKTKLNVYPSMLIAMISGRIIYGIIFNALAFASGGTLKALSVWGAILSGIPGIIIQLALIPLIIIALDKTYTKQAETKAKSLLKNNDATCVVISDDAIIHSLKGNGVKPLIQLYDADKKCFKNAYVLDKIIGKAAAMLIILGGAKKVYAGVISKSAYEYLTNNHCKIEFGKKVDIIKNRKGDGMCPLEASVVDINDPYEGYLKLKETIKTLMQGK